MGYGYTHTDVRAIAKKVFLAKPPAEKKKARQPPAVEPPKSGGTGKHAGIVLDACDVCGERHISSAGRPKDEVQCWNKRNKAEHLRNPKKPATKDAFRKLAEDNPDKYVPFKKQRVV